MPTLVKQVFMVEVLAADDQTGIDDMLEAALEACNLSDHGFTVTAVIEQYEPENNWVQTDWTDRSLKGDL
jgi:hypothetical protein